MCHLVATNVLGALPVSGCFSRDRIEPFSAQSLQKGTGRVARAFKNSNRKAFEIRFHVTFPVPIRLPMVYGYAADDAVYKGPSENLFGFF